MNLFERKLWVSVDVIISIAINIVVVVAMRFLERALAVPGYISGK